jgi:hypothetical protein
MSAVSGSTNQMCLCRTHHQTTNLPVSHRNIFGIPNSCEVDVDTGEVQVVLLLAVVMLGSLRDDHVRNGGANALVSCVRNAAAIQKATTIVARPLLRQVLETDFALWISFPFLFCIYQLHGIILGNSDVREAAFAFALERS